MDRKVQPLGARRRHDVRRIAGKVEAAVLHRLCDEAVHAGDALLEDRPLVQRPPFQRGAHLELLPEAPHLQQLSDETGFTVNMAILDGTDIVYVERCRSGRAGQREIDLNPHVGARLPAYCTSLGKVLLAFLPPDEQAAALEQIDFTRRGPNTLTSRTALGLELKRVRENGFAINNEELAYGLRSIAAPILTHDGVAAAAINLAVHSSMVSLEDLAARLSATLRGAAADISARLGYRP